MQCAWCFHQVALWVGPKDPPSCGSFCHPWGSLSLSIPHRGSSGATSSDPLGLLSAVPPSFSALQDVKRCLNALEELGTLQVTSHILQKNTDVVATLKKVRLEPGGGRGLGQAGPSR